MEGKPATPSARARAAPFARGLLAVALFVAAGSAVLRPATSSQSSAPAAAGSRGPEFYVSPAGKRSCNGSMACPWDLATALAQPRAVVPGSTVWLRGGTYTGRHGDSVITFPIGSRGAPGKPIVYRSYPGELASFDCQTEPRGVRPGTCVGFSSNYTWLWGIEIVARTAGPTVGALTPDKTSDAPGSYGTVNYGAGVGAGSGTGNKLINCYVHDTAGGIANTSGSSEFEAYGNVIWNNGWDGPMGYVDRIDVTEGGAGYPPPVTGGTAGGSCAHDPAFAVFASDGRVVDTYIRDGGDCTSQPRLVAVGGGGTGAAFTGTWNANRALVAIRIDDGGRDYLSTRITRGPGDTTGKNAFGQGYTVVEGRITAIETRQPGTDPTGAAGTGRDYCTTATAAGLCVAVTPACSIVSGVGSGAKCAVHVAVGDRGHGHGAYIQNETGSYTVKANISINNYGNSYQMYGSAGRIDGIDAENNVGAGAAGPSRNSSQGAANLAFWGGRPALRTVLKSNYLFGAGRLQGGSAGASVLRNIEGGVIASNYFVSRGDDSIDAGGRSGLADFPGTSWGGPAGANTFVGMALPHPAFETRYPENKFFRGHVDGVHDEYPTTRKVAVIPNEYDPARAHVVVLNWPAAQDGTPAASVEVDLASFLSKAAGYEIRSAENALGPAVAAGRCPPCGTVAIPMSAGNVAAPIGGAKTPLSMLPYFGAFIVTAIRE